MIKSSPFLRWVEPGTMPFEADVPLANACGILGAWRFLACPCCLSLSWICGFGQFFCVPPRRGRVFLLDKARVQSLTLAVPAWWDWEVVRAGGVGTRGMGKRERAEDTGKEGSSASQRGPERALLNTRASRARYRFV